MSVKAKLNRKLETGALALLSLSLASCSSVKGVLAADPNKDASKPISNPFGDYQAGAAESSPGDSMIFRTKRGDKAVEVEIPRANQGVTDFVIPVPEGSASRGLASSSSDADMPAPETAPDNRYANQAPTASDRELTRSFSQVPFEEQEKRNDIEKGLGLVASGEMTPERQKSYLASLDHVKGLYRSGRFEAGLIEVDAMIRDFPTDPKLHQMRGTLLDRLGRRDLAVKSWNQALRFDPGNDSLRQFIARHPVMRAAPGSMTPTERMPASVDVAPAKTPEEGQQ